MADAAATSHFYVGNYNTKMGHVDGKGIGVQRLALNEDSGEMTVVSLPQDVGINPTYLCYDDGILFVVNETHNGTVKSFNVNHETGALMQVSSLPSKGADPCYCETFNSPTLGCKLLLVPNYSSGSTIIFRVLDGGVLEEFAFYQHTMEKQGPNKNRQEAPHAHMARSFGLEQNLRVAVPDLGLDKVLTFTLSQTSERSGNIDMDQPLDMKSGDGPRHIEFHPNKHYAYVVSELANTVTVVSVDHAKSVFKDPGQIISTLPANYDNADGGNTCAHIQIHPNAKYLYVSNRGGTIGKHHSIACFAISKDGDSLTLKSATYFEHGKEPRAFCISPSGKYLIVGWQNTDNLASYEIQESGELVLTHVIECLTPVAFTWC